MRFSKSKELSICSIMMEEDQLTPRVSHSTNLELKEAINSLGIEAKAEAVWHMIAEIDKDGSGQLEFDEFFSMMTTRPSENESREEIHKVFVTFDSGRTGYIALKDLRKVAKDLGELQDDNTLQEMIERADFDLDNLVSEEEFYNLMTKKAYWSIHLVISIKITQK